MVHCPSVLSKQVKRRPEPRSESEETEEDMSSDDEYVAEKPKSKSGQFKRHPHSSSSDSDSGVSESSRHRRKRLHRASVSPGPSSQPNLKRKSTAQLPPPKRKKSMSVNASDDPTRKYCLGKLEDIFRDVFLRYPNVLIPDIEEGGGEEPNMKRIEKRPDELTDEEKEQILRRARDFATELEQCVYDIYCEPDKQGNPHAGGKYKDRFRTLQFNLSKADRVAIHRRMAFGNISAKEISVMTSTDLADEETKQHIKIAEQEALEHSILQKSTVPRAKITHKGLQDIEDINGELVAIREREREREREQEEEERRERERMARLRAVQTHQRQRTASLSVPPESPVVPQQSPTWGAPPPVPPHAITSASPKEETPSPTTPLRSPISTLFMHTPSELTVRNTELELNLDDLINIDEDSSAQESTAPDSSVVPPSPVSQDTPSPPDVTEKSPEEQTNPLPSPQQTTGISPFAARQSFDLTKIWSGPNAESTSPISPSSPKSPQVVTEEPKDIVMESDTIQGAEDHDFDMFLEEKEPPAPPPPPPVEPKFEDLPLVWTGKVSEIGMPLDASMQETTVTARQLGGRTIDEKLWKTLFPTEVLRIDGRVPIDSSCQFLLQTRMNPAKELIAVAFSPSDDDSGQSFKAISDFLIGKNRHGLIFPWGQRPREYCPGRELYLVPLQAADPLPECIELLDDLKLPKERTNNYMIGVWVLYKGKLAPLPTMPPPPFQTMLPPLTANITSTLFGNPATTPATGLDTTALAKEVATLTPEQIQNVLRTLASTAQVSSGQPPPPLLHPMPTMPIMPPPQPWNSQPPLPPPATYPNPPYRPPMPIPPSQPPGPPIPHGPAVPPPAPPASYDRSDQRDFRRDSRPPGQGHDRSDRGSRGRQRGRGRGRDGGSSPPRRPVDSGWPRRTWGDGGGGGPPSPGRRW
ncbi:hypothetical protein AMATHDRAFT_74665 [Amanita thiersii Skay4041]|uniref:TFIIS central domain-containing protein n=1 Tax=Amanita thiersii Skay4041 TaxID=703135 RepID=A0A2A9NVL7_9AGAR|nr:hypothetical protein AMATHDRAFT_74665 [Amanita thiersii Skay4041]